MLATFAANHACNPTDSKCCKQTNNCPAPPDTAAAPNACTQFHFLLSLLLLTVADGQPEGSSPINTTSGDGTNSCSAMRRPQQEPNQEIRIRCVETSTQANLVNKSHKAFDMKDVLTIPQVENTLSLLDSHRLYMPCRDTSSHSQHPQRTSSYWAEADPLAALKHDFLNYVCRRFLSSLVTWQPVNSVVWGAPKKPILLNN